MVLAIVLAALLLCFLLVRHHAGVPFLAMIAGLAIYENFGFDFAEMLNQWVPAIEIWMAQIGLYILLVALVPLILYLRIGRSGLFGILRIVESVVFAVVMTALLAPSLVQVFSFDELSIEIANWIAGVKGVMLVAGIILAYVDVFCYRPGHLS